MKEKTCILLVNEVYVKPMLQYHGGSLFGEAVNDPKQLANTVVGFTIVSLFGGAEFLYKTLPVKGLDSDFLFEQSNIIINQVRNLDGNIVYIICDGNTPQEYYKKYGPFTDNLKIGVRYQYLVTRPVNGQSSPI